MFTGEFHYKVDAKGRISVPKDFRHSSDGKYYVTYGPDSSLLVYDERGFMRRREALEKLDEFDPQVRSLKRVFFAGPPLQECDSHSRIRIPAKFMEYAGIDKDVVVNGMSSHFEIWSKEKWEEQSQKDITHYFTNYGEMTSRTSRRAHHGDVSGVSDDEAKK